MKKKEKTMKNKFILALSFMFLVSCYQNDQKAKRIDVRIPPFQNKDEIKSDTVKKRVGVLVLPDM